ncbi:MAG: TolC family protein, partial [Rhodospirillaceae bacterium]
EQAREFDLIDRRARLRSEVVTAHANAAQAFKSVSLIEKRLLPLAQQTLDVSISEYRSGAGDFLSVITAERNALSTEQSLHRAHADLYRQLAALERAAGGPLNNLPITQPGASTDELRATSKGTLP